MTGPDTPDRDSKELTDKKATQLKEQVFTVTQFDKLHEFYSDRRFEQQQKPIIESVVRDGLETYQVSIIYTNADDSADVASAHWYGAHPDTVEAGIVDARAYAEQFHKTLLGGADELKRTMVVEPGVHVSYMFGIGPEKTVSFLDGEMRIGDADYTPIAGAAENADVDIPELFDSK